VIDLRQLRSDPDAVLAAMARRGTPDLLDQLREAIALDVESRDIAGRRDALRAEVNDLSKQVGALRRAGDVDAAEAAQATSRARGEEERALAGHADEVQARLREVLLRIPNLPHPDAPDGSSDDHNPVVKGPVGLLTEYPDHQRVPHWEIGARLGILDNERATRIAQAMFTMQRGLGATMARALCQLALDRNADAFEEVRPPTLVSTATLTATGHLPKFADDAFQAERDDLWLIPTAEVPLTSLHAGEVMDEADMPSRVMAYTPCLPP
jgi:seryl-tRNA synthetase